MSGAVCPACGIAVVPGYVRCPKCHQPLPRSARITISPVGGTVVETHRKLPMYVAGGIAAVIAIFVVRHYVVAAFEDYRTRSAATGSRDAGPALAEATPSTTAPVLNAIAPSESTTAPIVRADEVARALEARLDKQRLWSTVQVIGDHVEVRSATCSDSGMRPAIDQSAAQFHAAGLTRLSCLEQSGGVVFIRAF
jgi:hypothetical protein